MLHNRRVGWSLCMKLVSAALHNIRSWWGWSLPIVPVHSNFGPVTLSEQISSIHSGKRGKMV